MRRCPECGATDEPVMLVDDAADLVASLRAEIAALREREERVFRRGFQAAYEILEESDAGSADENHAWEVYAARRAREEGSE